LECRKFRLLEVLCRRATCLALEDTSTTQQLEECLVLDYLIQQPLINYPHVSANTEIYLPNLMYHVQSPVGLMTIKPIVSYVGEQPWIINQLHQNKTILGLGTPS